MASTDNRMSDSLHRQRDALREAEQYILDKVGGTTRDAQDAQAQHEERMTFGESMADALAQLVGSWTFILSDLAMHQMEQRIVDKLRRPAQNAQNAQAQHEDQMTFGEHTADKLAHSLGKWTFILSYLAIRQAEQRILDKLRRPAQNAQSAQAQHEEQTTAGERKADKPGRSASRWSVILSVLAVIAVSITLIARRRPSGAGGQDAPEQAGAVR